MCDYLSGEDIARPQESNRLIWPSLSLSWNEWLPMCNSRAASPEPITTNLPPSKNVRNGESRKTEAGSSRALSELPTNQAKKSCTKFGTKHNSPRYEQPILPIIDPDHLHLCGKAFAGCADRRIQQADSRR